VEPLHHAAGAELLTAALLSSVCWWQLALLAAQPLPDPNLGPDQVIHTVVEALHNRNSPTTNAGIFTVYQFASPANRQITSPYGKFLRLVKLSDFAPLFARGVITYGPLALTGDHAEQEVNIHLDGGSSAQFRFVITRQTSQQTQGHCAGCWMVDQVIPIR
jgi:hypothetical protein